MKTVKFFFAISLALLLTASFSVKAGIPQSRTAKPIVIEANRVTYLVRIEHANYVSNYGNHFLIFVADESGQQIAPAQSFIPGKPDYRFTEGGTVRGTRVAMMVKVPFNPRAVSIQPAVMSGNFYGGYTYLFVINPIPTVTNTEAETN
jgi:hypothetical protein